MDAALLINNKDVPAVGGSTFERRDVLTGAVITRAAAATTANPAVPDTSSTDSTCARRVAAPPRKSALP